MRYRKVDTHRKRSSAYNDNLFPVKKYPKIFRQNAIRIASGSMTTANNKGDTAALEGDEIILFVISSKIYLFFSIPRHYHGPNPAG